MTRRGKKIKPEIIPTVIIKPWQITLYNQVIWPTKRPREKRDDETTQTEGKKSYKGKLTDDSLKNLKAAIKLLIAQSEEKTATNFKTNTTFKFRCNFVTLTLSAAQGEWEDMTIKRKVFDPWIKKAKRWFQLRNYVWRAERQQNQNIHFHLITDTYMDHKLLRDSWNQSQNLLNFIDDFEKKHGHRHPNSTDVHSIQQIKNLAAYICKYMTKDGDDKNLIDGKVWGCSTNLSKYKSRQLINAGKIREEVDVIMNTFYDRKFETEFATIIPMSEKEWHKALGTELMKEFKALIGDVRKNDLS